jgi:hypothetical protein
MMKAITFDQFGPADVLKSVMWQSRSVGLMI